MKTKIADLLLIDGKLIESNIDFVDFKDIKSDDPIAFYFGQRDKSLNKKLPNKRSKEYKELSKEYINGYKLK